MKSNLLLFLLSFFLVTEMICFMVEGKPVPAGSDKENIEARAGLTDIDQSKIKELVAQEVKEQLPILLNDPKIQKTIKDSVLKYVKDLDLRTTFKNTTGYRYTSKWNRLYQLSPTFPVLIMNTDLSRFCILVLNSC